ncbi:MAG: MBL fold metallo-hydrolase [Jatrophihabitans sp.]|uniref:MBL fold metallo-hydrolase n=1 Tax=Jatrophihabitans sp. TaxID=1932789 RepID=UPI003F80AA67
MTVGVTWWGHACVTVALGGRRVLTDPLLTDRLAHLRRYAAPVPAEAADADLVVVSHLHADHLHLPSLQRVRPDATVLVPAGALRLVRKAVGRDRVREVAPGDEFTVAGVFVRVVAAHHDGRRLPGSRHRGPAVGYVLSGASDPADSVWFAGDTGLFDGLCDIGPVRTAIVPVGGWGPTLGPEHLDPVQAAEAVRRVGAEHAVPIHFGTFWPVGLRTVAPAVHRHRFVEPGEAFAQALDGAAQAHVLAPGGSVAL